MPPLHIKLGLIKKIVKALDIEKRSFVFLLQKFPRISEAKLTAGIFDVPQIRELLKNPNFDECMQDIERKAFIQVYCIKSQESRIKTCFNARMHFLSFDLDYYSKNCGYFSSKEQRKRFHQEKPVMEGKYQGRWHVNMLADYCWYLKRDVPDVHH